MTEKKIVKTVRFNEGEIERVDLFLRKNPSLDFSTVIRLAVEHFISTPTLRSLKSEQKDNKDNLWS